MWSVLALLGIFSTFGPAPGSIEGLIYTTLPIHSQLLGLVEIIMQSFLLSAVLFYWVNHPEKKWVTWVLTALFFIVLFLPTLGLLVGGTL
jgi:hypothetical protein